MMEKKPSSAGGVEISKEAEVMDSILMYEFLNDVHLAFVTMCANVVRVILASEYLF